MKKIFGFISVFMSAVLIVFAALSCVINDVEKSRLRPSPELETADDKITYNISSAPITNMVYANIFREKCLSEEFENIEESLNIGQIIPTDRENLSLSFMFTDSYTQNDPNVFYRYRIRFFNGSVYTWSDYSPVVKGIGLGEATVDVAVPSLSYIWNDRDKKYYLSLGTETKTTKGFNELAVIFSNSANTRPFTLFYEPSVKEGDAGWDSDWEIFSAGEPELDLQKNFSEEFLDTNVDVKGLIGVIKTEEEKLSYTRYYWTVPRNLADDDDADFVIDFTDDEGVPGVKSGKTIYVPSQKQPPNIFDISKSSRQVENTAAVQNYLDLN